MNLKLLFIVYILHLVFNNINASDQFYETANFDVLNKNQLYTYLNFTVKSPQSNFQSKHYHLFPRSLGEIVKKYKVNELHFALTRGVWSWKKQPDSPSPAGAQVYAWFKKDVLDVDKRWKGLIASISALLCTSIADMPPDMTITTSKSFKPQGHYSEKDSSYMRYTNVLGENICTENLTPWKKLLPCFSSKGAASLVGSMAFHKSYYFSIGLHFHSECADHECSDSLVVLRQDLTSVVKLEGDKSPNSVFNSKATFGVNLAPSCGLASTSEVRIADSKGSFVTPKGFEFNDGEHTLDMHKNFSKVIKLRKESSEVELNSIGENGITNKCFVVEKDLNGRMVCTIKSLYDEKVPVSFLQVFPWLIYIRSSSLELKNSENVDIKPTFISYKPSEFRKSSSVLTVDILMEPGAEVTLSVEFQKGFLKWYEHPPAAHQGLYISPSVLTFVQPNKTSTQNVYSQPLLVSLPVPDFSMPYNVICFVSTVIAICFGQLYNISSKQVKFAEKPKPPIKKLIDVVVDKVKKIKQFVRKPEVTVDKKIS